MKVGTVYLIGAGPGDPGLITVKGLDLLARADVVVHDRLINLGFLALARPDAEVIDVSKEAGKHMQSQEDINTVLVAKAREGKTVARLKGGDPFLFGRGGEEAQVLVEAGIPFEVVPGVTSALAVPAYAGIPVTHRQFSSSVAIVTGHEDPAKEFPGVDWARLATATDTLILLMAMTNLEKNVEQLLRHGRSPRTPVALIYRGTEPAQRTVTGTLEDIVARAQEASLKAPVIVVVGEVVSLRRELDWFEGKPLFGKRVLVTRTRSQASALARRLQEEGAWPLELPVIEVGPPPDWAPLDQALGRLNSYAWIAFTSVHGVEYFFQRLRAQGQDARALQGVRLAAIGEATAQALEAQGLLPDLVPQDYSAAGLLAALQGVVEPGARFLLPRALEVPEELASGLREMGTGVDQVPAYQTLPASQAEAPALGMLRRGEVDIITLTSSSTARHLLALLRGDTAPVNRATVACIGPVTAGTARELGLRVDVVAQEHTIPGLVAALVEMFAARKQASKGG